MKYDDIDYCPDNVLTTESGTPIQLPIQPGNVLELDKLTEMRYYGEYDDRLFFYPVEGEDRDWMEKIDKEAGLGTVKSCSDDEFEERFYSDVYSMSVKLFNSLTHSVSKVIIDKKHRIAEKEPEQQVTGEFDSVVTTSDVGIPIHMPVTPGDILEIDDYRLRYYGEDRDSLFFFPVKYEGDNWRKKYRNHREIGLNSVLPLDDDDFSEKYYPNLDEFYVGNFNSICLSAEHITLERVSP